MIAQFVEETFTTRTRTVGGNKVTTYRNEAGREVRVEVESRHMAWVGELLEPGGDRCAWDTSTTAKLAREEATRRMEEVSPV